METRVRRALVSFDVDPVTDPLSVLMQVAGEALAFVQAAGSMVNELPEIRYTSNAGTEQLRAEVGLYERGMNRLIKVLVDLIRLRVEERLVRIEEDKAALLLVAIESALAAVGVHGPDAVVAKRVMAQHLRAIAGEPAPPEGA